jgi:hypothetical protein
MPVKKSIIAVKPLERRAGMKRYALLRTAGMGSPIAGKPLHSLAESDRLSL